MAGGKPADVAVWRRLLAGVLLVAGIGLIAWSFVGPIVIGRPTGWSQEQARQYQAAAAKLHELSHGFAQQSLQESQPTLRRDLDEAQAEFDALRAELETAMERPRYIVWLLRLGGTLLAAVGMVGLMVLPTNSREASTP